MINTQFGVSIERVNLDNARDYSNPTLTPFFQIGVIYEPSCVDKPHQNGVAERKTMLPRKVLGCVSFVHIHTHNRGKLDLRALKCVFVGYSTTKKGYKCYHPTTRKTFISMDVTLMEKKSFFRARVLIFKGRVSREDKKFFINFGIFFQVRIFPIYLKQTCSSRN